MEQLITIYLSLNGKDNPITIQDYINAINRRYDHNYISNEFIAQEVLNMDYLTEDGHSYQIYEINEESIEDIPDSMI